MGRVPVEKRWPLALGLAARGEFAGDRVLPLMIWYGIESLVPDDPERAAKLLAMCRLPLVRQYIARRIAAMAE